MRRFATLIAIITLGLAACDSTPSLEPPGEGDGLSVLEAAPSAWMSPGVFRMALGDNAILASDDYFQRQLGERLSDVYLVESAGLWFAGVQAGQVRATVQRDKPDSNSGPCPDTPEGVFHVFSDTLYSADGWPSEHGAPTVDGNPSAYGDEMLWTSVCAEPGSSSPILSLHRPIQGVRINAAAFVHDDLETAVFVRYEIRNEGTTPVQDAYAGIYSDFELQDPGDNLLGYSSEHQLAYVYMDPFDERADVVAARGPSARGAVGGVMMLETPDAQPVAAHRNITRGRDALGESSQDSVDDYLYALRGLDFDGNPILNPETGMTTPFAYSGDPTTGEGWIDGYDLNFDAMDDGLADGEDVRSLLSAGPFDLAPGETKVLTVAYLIGFGSGLNAGLELLRQSAAGVRSRPSLWRFPVAS